VTRDDGQPKDTGNTEHKAQDDDKQNTRLKIRPKPGDEQFK